MTANFSTRLPASKTSAVNAVDVAASDHGVAVIIDQKRTITEYRVTEFRVDGGRGFRFAKVEGGTDKTESHYNVLLTGGHYDTCDCKGFQRHGHCKHLDSAREIADRTAPAVKPITKPVPARKHPSDTADLQGGF